jgi:23S rRNA (guanine745-N1)-methyltransferase
VRLAGGHDDHMAPGHLPLAVGAAEGGLSLEHDEDLGVVVGVQRRPAARRGIQEEERHVCAAMVGALELERVVCVSQLVISDHLHGCQYAPVLAVDLLRCPVCAGALEEGDGVLRCAEGHSFDVARQGYVNLVPGPGDTAEMVEARDAFLSAGHFARLTNALEEAAREAGGDGAVVDLGAGTGHHLARLLDALPERTGVAIDSSTAALRRAARAHPRAAAVGADAWRDLPLRAGTAALILSVFAPRNPTEMARVLAPRGAVLAVTPTTRHLFELVGPLGLLSVPEDKSDRLDEQLGSHFALSERRSVEHAMFLNREEAAQLIRMGPSAWHVDEQTVAERLALLPDPLTVTASMTLSRYARAS